ncbi:MAG: hypothetical protein JWM95_586 [Gemmatimonadetes bacterium]|nr:hypothetical protein [Gemmatimonadota bacterium]
MSISARSVLLTFALSAVAIGSAEAAARIDDWIRLDVPLVHTPDYDHDLKLRDWFGIRGRPNGHYQQWRLNRFGFRGPEMAVAAAPGCRRVMILGASESFGLYESENREYPAQLRDSLQRSGCYEVLNAAIAGAGLRSIIRLWEYYAAQFHPDVVVIYPTPAFYLSEVAPGWTPLPGHAPPDTKLPPRPRLIEHFHNVWSTPDIIQSHRVARWIAADTAGKPSSWFFPDPPTDRVDVFISDLDSLVKAIRASGSQPVLVTHAMRFAIPPDPRDSLLLLSWDHFTPRARPLTLLTFDVAAASRMRKYASAHHVPLGDAQQALNGRRSLFGDFIHFNDTGSAIMAGLITHVVLAVSPRAHPRLNSVP